MSWPDPDPVDLADGSLTVAATAPRAGVVVVRAIGEIDLLTAPAWQRTLDAAVRIAGSSNAWHGVPPGGVLRAPAGRWTPRLVCDLSAVSFLGATGLGVLVEIARQSAEHRVELVLVADDHGPIGRLLRIGGLDRRITVRRRLDHAVQPAESTEEDP